MRITVFPCPTRVQRYSTNNGVTFLPHGAHNRSTWSFGSIGLRNSRSTSGLINSILSDLVVFHKNVRSNFNAVLFTFTYRLIWKWLCHLDCLWFHVFYECLNKISLHFHYQLWTCAQITVKEKLCHRNHHRFDDF